MAQFANRDEYLAWKAQRMGASAGAATATMEPPPLPGAPPAASGPAVAAAIDPDVDKKIKGAVGAALASGVMTTIAALIAMTGMKGLPVGPSALLDAAFIFGMAYGISRRSRACAVLMLVYFVASKIYMMAQGGPAVAGLAVTILLTIWFVRGVQGTFAWHAAQRS